jgi:hypothetical protein
MTFGTARRQRCHDLDPVNLPPHVYFFPDLIFAHRARCAAAILFRPAADILRRGPAVAAFAAFLPDTL